ncbi:MAG: YfhO family protein [Bryobacteraceae bacterium]|nr:YfhO family protein [Bryobacteraceae bacterium]
MKYRTASVTFLLAAVTLFYAKALVGNVTIQWDAVGYFYPYQRHFSDSIRAGRLPFWTDTIFSGFPFLADLQVGSWYPLNWPFFLLGIVPRSIFWELWLHALLAGGGAYLLCRRLADSRRAAILTALFYSLSGFFAAHSEHVALFQAAAYLPILIYLLLRAVEVDTVRWTAAGALAGGCLCLTGHFQTVMYVFAGLGLAALGLFAGSGRLLLRASAVVAAVMAGSALLGAIQIMPSAELLGQSLRTRLTAGDWTLGIVQAGSLATFVHPNIMGALHPETYQGPPDITQHYFYSGFLLVPLAAIGFWVERRLRLPALLLVIPAVVYAMGPPALIYSVLIRLPGFSSVRAPSHGMFVAILGLSLLAGAGAIRLVRLARRPSLYFALLGILLLDLWYWNMQRNPLVYARGSYEQAYGPAERWFQELTKFPLPRFQRLAAPGRTHTFYPADAPFAFPVETTFGTNALMLSRYHDYLAALNENPALMGALGVGPYFDRDDYVIRQHTPVLPRFHFPPEIRYAPDPFALLAAADPARMAIMTRREASVAGNASGEVEVLDSAPGAYRLRVTAPSDAVMRIAVPYYPGWRAEIDGLRQEVVVVDHALMGLPIPGGTHSVRLWFRSNYFAVGAVVSVTTAVACMFILIRGRRGRV